MTQVSEGDRKINLDDGTHWQVQNAPQEAVNYILVQNEKGKSQWVWIRLPGGDLVLAIYPQDDCYFSTEHWRTI